MKEGIDIDRLHKVYFGQLSDLGCGRTTLFATYIIGISELPDYNDRAFYVLFRWMQDQENAFMVCVETCKKANVHYRILGRHVILINKTAFSFLRDRTNNRNGRYNTIFYDENIKSNRALQ